MTARDELPEVILLRGEPELASHRPPDDAPRAERDAWFAEHCQCRVILPWGRCRYGVRQPHTDACAACSATRPARTSPKRVATPLADDS